MQYVAGQVPSSEGEQRIVSAETRHKVRCTVRYSTSTTRQRGHWPSLGCSNFAPCIWFQVVGSAFWWRGRAPPHLAQCARRCRLVAAEVLLFWFSGFLSACQRTLFMFLASSEDCLVNAARSRYTASLGPETKRCPVAFHDVVVP